MKEQVTGISSCGRRRCVMWHKTCVCFRIGSPNEGAPVWVLVYVCGAVCLCFLRVFFPFSPAILLAGESDGGRTFILWMGRGAQAGTWLWIAFLAYAPASYLHHFFPSFHLPRKRFASLFIQNTLVRLFFPIHCHPLLFREVRIRWKNSRIRDLWRFVA